MQYLETSTERFIMSTEKLGDARSFRQWLRNQKRLEQAEKLGLNVSELVNRTLDRAFTDVLRQTLEERRQETEKALSALVS